MRLEVPLLTKKVIFDCDNTMGLRRKEVDDGLALYYLLGRSDIDLLGVTTVFGNGSIAEVYPQTLKALEEIGRGDLPILKGAAEAGQRPTEAAEFLAETVSQHPGEVILLATAPLTNLWAASQLDGSFFDNVQQICCMGGYLHPLRIGHRDVAELNLSGDPEASFAVLNAPCPVTLMDAHICLQAPFRPWDLWHIRGWDRRVQRMIRHWLLVFAVHTGVPSFYLWDLLPAVYLSYPELYDENLVRLASTPEDLEDGTLLVAESEQGALVNMPSQILDRKRFMRILYQTWDKVLA
jgi:inosine-uridine nucleoside N-ribohydrolase